MMNGFVDPIPLLFGMELHLDLAALAPLLLGATFWVVLLVVLRATRATRRAPDADRDAGPPPPMRNAA